MNRFLSSRASSLPTARWLFTSSQLTQAPKGVAGDALDDLFSQLEDVPTSSGVSAAADRTKGVPPSEERAVGSYPSRQRSSPTGSSADEATRAALQRGLKEAMEEEQQLVKEEARESRRKNLEGYRPTAAAKVFLSTGEMIADKAPQHFIPAEQLPDGVPEVTESGSAAIVSLVGKVVRRGGEAVAAVYDEMPTFDFTVEYAVPSRKSQKVMQVSVYCVGATLATFAREHVEVGTIVHVLGHLIPAGEGGSHRTEVHALPFGGNVSIVARTIT